MKANGRCYWGPLGSGAPAPPLTRRRFRAILVKALAIAAQDEHEQVQVGGLATIGLIRKLAQRDSAG